ncbi:hypothetical protein DV702_14415 [Sporosarcina sp. PTS2304]|nr:hypothetical protein DV702_14415 [Sporosarcina sp. PTS2304]
MSINHIMYNSLIDLVKNEFDYSEANLECLEAYASRRYAFRRGRGGPRKRALRVTPVVLDPPGVDRLPASAVLCVQDSLITLCRGENQVELSDTMRPLLKVDSGEVLSATMIVSMN